MRRFAIGVVCFLAVTTAGRAQDAAGADFFEKRIRPILVEHCYSCHSAQAKKPRAGLFLDHRDGVRKGGVSGPAIVPGKPDESLLLKAVRHLDPEIKMPPAPEPKLSDQQIADLAEWVRRGAPDPRLANGGPKRGEIDFAAARKHWAYQPLKMPELPVVKNAAWVRAPIDRFILARLEEKGLTPSPPADPRTLLRRLYFDLIGLPPTAAEVDAFLKDCCSPMPSGPSPLEKVVDRLLASPHYGERWGRHWLDVARYADTKDGVLMYGDDRIRPYAFTYRDYVIRAFNDDTPFDRFVHEQLAADMIEPKVESWRLAAMGYLTLGRMFDNNVHDVIDDRIDTVSRGMLGLTVSCARCHDHKYDAVSIADYYSLYGVFANSEAPLELPPCDQPEKYAGAGEYEKQAGPQRKKIEELLDQQHTLLSETARQRIGDYLVRVATTQPDLSETAVYFLSLQPSELRPPIVMRWRRYLEHPERGGDPVFGPWPELVKLPEANYAKDARALVERWQPRLNKLVKDALYKAALNSRADVARAYGDLLRRTYDESKKKKTVSEAEKELVEVLTGKNSPAYFARLQTPLHLSRTEKDAYNGMRTQFDKIAVKLPTAPPRAMVLVDADEIVEPKILLRGNPATPGDPVPRRFLRVLAGEKAKPFTHGSGRLDLAKAITAPDNPLTARVLVNRVWMHHFGEPLVSTPNDFGVRSSPPSHPELLDYLATSFQQDGWSLKKLHRRIVLSNAYQQASFDRPACREVDPENRLLWRANRRRLDLEAMRDALLAVSGRLDKTMGGRPVDIANDPANKRRTVYGMVDRQSLPGLFRNFDFASPDQSAERRPLTTVPQQALFGMNSPFMIEQVKALAARAEVGKATTPEQRVAALYRLALGRAPEEAELHVGVRFLAAPPTAEGGRSQLTPLQQYAQVLLMTNEMLFVD